MQMLEVALARRMCCSRACSVSVNPARPSRSTRAPDDASRHLPHILHARRHEAEVRAARGQRHAQRLPLTDGDVSALGAPLSGRLQQRQRSRIDDGDDQNAARMRPVGQRIDILQPPEEVRLLDDQRGDVLHPRTSRARSARSTPSAGGVRHFLEAQPLIARRGAAPPGDSADGQWWARECAATSICGSRAPP